MTDPTVAVLRRRADAAVPPMSLDPATVLTAGRARRRRLRTVRLAVPVAVLAAAAVAVPWLGQRLDAPASLAQRERALGSGQIVQLAQDVYASNRPVAVTLPDGTPGLDTGLTLPADTSPEGTTFQYPLVMRMARADEVGGTAPTTGIALSWMAPAVTGDAYVLTWPKVWSSHFAADLAAPLLAFRHDRQELTVLTGVAPLSLVDPRLVLYSADPVTTVDDRLVHLLEVPLFSAPTLDGRLMYVVRAEIALHRDVDRVPVFIGTDGSIVLGGVCAGTSVQACADVVGPGLLDAAATGFATD